LHIHLKMKKKGLACVAVQGALRERLLFVFSNPPMRTLLLLSLFGLLFLTGCNSDKPIVMNLNGDLLGEIRLGDPGNATVIDSYGQAQGRVRGDVVRDENGKNVGRIIERDGELSILNEDGMEVGTLQSGTDCYTKEETFVGSIGMEVDQNAAAGACLLLILSK
jgi:hypothetical protein